MIILSIGSNISSIWGSRFSTVKKSITKLEEYGILIHKISNIYHSPPMTLLTKRSINIETIDDVTAKSDKMDKYNYLNICVSIETSKPPLALLYCLKQIEKEAGRLTGQRWSSRPLDIDIICYHNVQMGEQIEYNKASNHGHLPLGIPHAGLKMRNFVLKPLQDIAPNWHHPVTGEPIHQLIRQLK